ncbi:MAG: hypothetical protein ABI706_14725 [Ilumatobacteraceae bacterium]
MDTNEDGKAFEPPTPQIAPPSGPTLPPPMPIGPPLMPLQAAPPFAAHEGEPTATVVPAGAVGKRSRGKVVGGLVAVVALLGAGGFAVSKIVAGNDGGAASPTEVGTRLMDALAAEDALGVVDLLLPGERDMMRQPLIDIVDNLKRLEIVDDTATLQKVGGLDINFGDVHVDPTDTNVAEISDIRITATGTASVDGAAVPIGNLLIDEAFGSDRPELGSDPQDSAIDWKLATVKRDGRWYLSAFYSIAENARQGGHDIPETPVVARGADTPEGAVQAIFDAVDDLDVESLIAALNPNEAEALQRYAPMFIDGAQGGIDDLDAKIAFSDIKYTVSGSGDRRTVAIDGFNLKASANGTDVTVENKDGCVVFTSGDTTADSCQVAGSIDDALGVLGLDETGDVKSLIKTIEDAFSDMKPVGITVQKVGGAWYVSPIGTYFDVYVSLLSALDKGELTDIIDGVKKVSESFSTSGIFGLGGDTTGISDDPNGTDSSAFDACFDQTDYAGYSACVSAGLGDGSIDPTFVAPYYRFPECGVGEQYWSGAVYSMSDEDFIAFGTAAAPCFQKYVDDGTIFEFELPYELSHPDCLEGKNWYNVADADYTERVFECATS